MRRKLFGRLGALITAILLLFPLSVFPIGADTDRFEVGNAYQTYFFSNVKTVGENLLDSAEWVDREDYDEYQPIHSTAWIELQPGRTYYLHMDFVLHPFLDTGKKSGVCYYSPTMHYTDISDGELLIHTRKDGATFIEIGRYFSDQDMSDWEIYAVSSYRISYDVSKTDFQTDAQNLFPEIDLTAYTGSSADYIEMITMHEDQPELYPNISVFLYLFNPSGKRVTGGSFSFLTSHSATLSVVGEATSDPRFVKFKVGGWGCRYQTVGGVENKHIRRYDVGDVTLRYADGTSERFAYEGYFLIEDQFDATGAVTSYKVGSHFDSRVELDFDYTYYRTDTSSVGAYYHNQVDSIYFNIPNRLREDYGKLVDVKVAYRKARTKPVVVVDDQTLYHAFYKGIGKGMDGSDTSVPGFYTDARFNNSMTTCSYGDSYNVRHEWRLHNHSGKDQKKHPAYVFAASTNKRKFLCFTHSASTNGIANVKLRHNVEPSDPRDCYIVPRSMIEKDANLETMSRKFRIHSDDLETVKKYKK